MNFFKLIKIMIKVEERIKFVKKECPFLFENISIEELLELGFIEKTVEVVSETGSANLLKHYKDKIKLSGYRYFENEESEQYLILDIDSNKPVLVGDKNENMSIFKSYIEDLKNLSEFINVMIFVGLNHRNALSVYLSDRTNYSQFIYQLEYSK